MNGRHQLQHDIGDGIVRQYEYDDELVLVADFGATDGAVDVVDGTVIVVIGDRQYEIELPSGESHVTMNNGVVTAEVSS